MRTETARSPHQKLDSLPGARRRHLAPAAFAAKPLLGYAGCKAALLFGSRCTLVRRPSEVTFRTRLPGDVSPLLVERPLRDALVLAFFATARFHTFCGATCPRRYSEVLLAVSASLVSGYLLCVICLLLFVLNVKCCSHCLMSKKR